LQKMKRMNTLTLRQATRQSGLLTHMRDDLEILMLIPLNAEHFGRGGSMKEPH
jgi:hypothetical protein